MNKRKVRKVALITGSTDGLGREVARSLAAAGFEVLIHGRDEPRGSDLVRQISEQGGSARFHRADFTSLAEVRALADSVRRDHDRLHLLINNAGIGTGDDGRAAPRRTSAEGYELQIRGQLSCRLPFDPAAAADPGARLRRRASSMSPRRASTPWTSTI